MMMITIALKPVTMIDDRDGDGDADVLAGK